MQKLFPLAPKNRFSKPQKKQLQVLSDIFNTKLNEVTKNLKDVALYEQQSTVIE